MRNDDAAKVAECRVRWWNDSEDAALRAHPDIPTVLHVSPEANVAYLTAAAGLVPGFTATSSSDPGRWVEVVYNGPEREAEDLAARVEWAARWD